MAQGRVDQIDVAGALGNHDQRLRKLEANPSGGEGLQYGGSGTPTYGPLNSGDLLNVATVSADADGFGQLYTAAEDSTIGFAVGGAAPVPDWDFSVAVANSFALSIAGVGSMRLAGGWSFDTGGGGFGIDSGPAQWVTHDGGAFEVDAEGAITLRSSTVDPGPTLTLSTASGVQLTALPVGDPAIPGALYKDGTGAVFQSA